MLKGYLYCIAAGSLWGSIGPLAKVAYGEGMGALEVAFWRTALAWLVFAAQAVYTKQVRVPWRDLPYLVGFGVLGVAGLHGFYCLAVRDGGAALAAVLLYTAPAWVLLLAWVFLKESLTPLKLAAVALTVLGVCGVSFGAGPGQGAVDGAVGIVFGLAAGLSYATYYIFGKRLCRHPTPTLLLYALPTAALTLLPFCEFSTPTPTAWAACGAMALAATYLALTLYYLGLRRLEAGRAAVAATCEPVVAGVMSYAFFGELFGPLGFAGGGLVIGAVLLSVWDSMRLARVSQRAG